MAINNSSECDAGCGSSGKTFDSEIERRGLRVPCLDREKSRWRETCRVYEAEITTLGER